MVQVVAVQTAPGMLVTLGKLAIRMVGEPPGMPPPLIPLNPDSPVRPKAFEPLLVSAGATKLLAQLPRNLTPSITSRLAAILGLVVEPTSL